MITFVITGWAQEYIHWEYADDAEDEMSEED